MRVSDRGVGRRRGDRRFLKAESEAGPSAAGNVKGGFSIGEVTLRSPG